MSANWDNIELRDRAIKGELVGDDYKRLMRLLADDGDSGHWVRRRDQRAVLVALHSRGGLQIPKGTTISFCCEGCGLSEQLRRSRKHLVRHAGSRSFLVCKRCVDPRRRLERCEHLDDFGRRCSRVARKRSARCARHADSNDESNTRPAPIDSLEVAWARLSPRCNELVAAHAAWSGAPNENGEPTLRKVVRAAFAYIDESLELAEEGHLNVGRMMETRRALAETLTSGLPVGLSARIAELERRHARGRASQAQLALHGLAREPMLLVRFVPFDTAEGTDLSDEEVEAEKEKIRALPEAKKRDLLRECAPLQTSR